VVLPSAFALSTPDVFREADRLDWIRNDAQLANAYLDVVGVMAPGARLPDELIVNDLEPAAISLCPACGDALVAVREAGAEHAIVSGSGPTVVGIWWGAEAVARAAAAASELRTRYPGASVATPVGAEYAAPALI
jgi:4-diphosphocytidyl-2-C-methyl-D-erythritol kinase